MRSAFVLQLDSDTHPAERRVAGRIEEVDTRTGPRQVLLGNGYGMAFQANVDLDQAKAELRNVTRKGGEKK